MKRQNDKTMNPPFDAYNDRPAELDELNFNDDEESSLQDFVPEYEFELVEEETTNDTVDNNPSDDDLTPENLIPQDGSRSPHEPGGTIPHDENLSIVSEDEIGEGYGLDEAELARIDPLDGKIEK